MKKLMVVFILGALALFSACSESDRTKDISDRDAEQRSPAADDARETVAVEKQVDLFYFYGSGCPNCEQAKRVIENLTRNKWLRVKQYEVWYNKGNRDMLLKMAREKNLSVKGVPAVIIGNDLYLGVTEISALEKKIDIYKKQVL